MSLVRQKRIFHLLPCLPHFSKCALENCTFPPSQRSSRNNTIAVALNLCFTWWWHIKYYANCKAWHFSFLFLLFLPGLFYFIIGKRKFFFIWYFSHAITINICIYRSALCEWINEWMKKKIDRNMYLCNLYGEIYWISIEYASLLLGSQMYFILLKYSSIDEIWPEIYENSDWIFFFSIEK